MIRVVLPSHLRTLAREPGEIRVAIAGAATIAAVLDEIEARYPALRGSIRDQATKRRRPFVRFFACKRDLSHDAPDAPLPDPIVRGEEALLIVGAMAGG